MDIGVAVFVKKGNTILIGKRGRGRKRGVGCWALPGGLVEDGETVISVAFREVTEETGLYLKPLPMECSVGNLLAVTETFPGHDNRGTPGQDVRGTLGNVGYCYWIMTEWLQGDPVITEPNKCEKWLWVTPDKAIAMAQEVYESGIVEQSEWIPAKLWSQILLPFFGHK